MWRLQYWKVDVVVRKKCLLLGAYVQTWPHAVEVYVFVVPFLPVRVYLQWEREP